MFVPLGDVVNRWPFVLWNVGVLRKKVKKKIQHKEHIRSGNQSYCICKVQIWKHGQGNDKERLINGPRPIREALCVCPEVVNNIHISPSGHFNVSSSWKRNHGIHMDAHTNTKEGEKNTLFFTCLPPVCCCSRPAGTLL